MTQTLETTRGKITAVRNQVNASLIEEFDQFMQGNGTSEKYQNNNLKAIINYAQSLDAQSGAMTTLFDIDDKEQIIAFLNTKIKSEKVDPDKKWITTWNDYLARLKFFFRWLHNVRKANKKQDEVPMEDWETPDFVKIKKKKSKRVSPYSANEIWELDELLLAIKYEPLVRNQAAIMMAWDLDARNHEVTNIGIKNVRFKERYAEGEIPDGKTGSGPILLTASYPYVLSWYNQHPFKNNPRAKLICDLRTGRQIDPDYLWKMMMNLRKRILTLLKSGAIKDEKEREKLEYLVSAKKWNPYCIRHSAISSDSDYLPGYALNKKVRWSPNSKQPGRYIKNRLSDDLKKTILAKHGLIEQDATVKHVSIKCPKCDTINALGNDYCSRKECGYPLTPKAFDEIKKIESETLADLKEVKEFAAMVRNSKIMDLLRKDG